MRLFALADLHLAFGVPSKDMSFFGPTWENYAQRIEKNWRQKITPSDLVLLPGDLSWALSLEEARIDLEWIDALPGKKVILKGNHDYWWPSAKKLQALLPPSMTFVYNNAVTVGKYVIGGTRLWDSPEYGFSSFITFKENSKERTPIDGSIDKNEEEKIFERELSRLRLSLSQLPQEGGVRIAMIHYPPIGADLAPSRTAAILEEFQIEHCVFGHLHNVQPGSLPFGKARGVHYHLTAADYLDFTPLQIC